MTGGGAALATELHGHGERHGCGERPRRGERLVLVHGFTQTGRSWDGLAQDLAHHYEVVTVDLPDHGRSAEQHAASLEEAATMLGASAGRATYVGYSLGGRVCLTLALEHPEIVERLVLVGATAGIADSAERARRRAADEALADRLDPPQGSADPGLSLQAFLEEWLAGPLFAHLSAEQADRPARASNTPAGLARSLRGTGTGTQRPSHERLGTLSMPVLLVAGALDEKFSATAREMAELVGDNAAVAIIPGASHAVPFETPADFLATLASWLEQTPMA